MTFDARKPLAAGRLAPASRGLVSDDAGGAAIVEFAFAIMPILILFFGMIQWSILSYVNLIVHHAAYVAARAEAVMRPSMPDNGGATGTTSDLEKAIMPLFVHVTNVADLGGISNLSVTIPTQSKNTCDQTMNEVQVDLKYPCFVPLGNAVVCGGATLFSLGIHLPFYYHTLTAKAKFPNQGSYYQKVWSSQIGGSASCK